METEGFTVSKSDEKWVLLEVEWYWSQTAQKKNRGSVDILLLDLNYVLLLNITTKAIRIMSRTLSIERLGFCTHMHLGPPSPTSTVLKTQVNYAASWNRYNASNQGGSIQTISALTLFQLSQYQTLKENAPTLNAIVLSSSTRWSCWTLVVLITWLTKSRTCPTIRWLLKSYLLQSSKNLWSDLMFQLTHTSAPQGTKDLERAKIGENWWQFPNSKNLRATSAKQPLERRSAQTDKCSLSITGDV